MGSVAQFRMPAPGSDPASALAAVIARMATGDERALESFYDLTSGRVFALTLQIVRDRALAEEATLDTFAQAWRQAGRFEPAKGSAIAWLLSIGRTRALDTLRTRAKAAERTTSLEAALSIPSLALSPEAESGESQRAARVRRALMSLSAEQREALLCSYFCGMTHTEIATASSQPLGTIKTRIRSGLMLLRRLLTEDGDSVA